MEDLDEEGQNELYQSILAFMKNSEDSLGLCLSDDTQGQREVSVSRADQRPEAREVEVANASTSTEPDATNVGDELAEVIQQRAPNQTSTRSEPDKVEIVEADEEEDSDLKTKQLLEEAVAESIGKR